MAAASLPIRVLNPRKLGTWQIPCERADLGPGYKPSMALLPDGELVLVSLLAQGSVEAKTYHEATPLRRSRDGGKTWSDPVILGDVIGREQWLSCTSRGTLFMSSHLLVTDTANTDRTIHGYLHRSLDRGRTWERTKVLLTGAERQGAPLNEWGSHTSRDVVELPDGTLLFGVSICGSAVAYLWKSRDGGASWDKSRRAAIGPYHGKPYDNLDGFFCEDFTYRTPAGKLLHWIRCGPPSPMYPMEDGRAVPAGDDGIDRTLVCESRDGGVTWDTMRDFGDYGMHYIRVIALRDGRTLITFTQRSTFYPIGLRAIVAGGDAEHVDFANDHIVIDGGTPWGAPSGGGFGNTIELPDGTLISCYSTRKNDDTIRIETVRWKLP